MKLTFKTLQQTTFGVEIDEDSTTLQLKQKVQAEQGHEVAHQKLIHQGKILEDAKKLSEYGIKDGHYLVIIARAPAKPAPAKPAVAPSPAPASTASAPAPTATTPAPSTPAPAAEKKPTPAPATPAAPAPTAAAPTTPATPATPSATPASAAAEPEPTSAEREYARHAQLLIGRGSEEYRQAVANIVEMGFEEELVHSAMRASYNNPDRAVEYLMSGIPPELMQVESQADSGAAATGAVPASAASPAPAGAAPASAPAAAAGGSAPFPVAAPSAPAGSASAGSDAASAIIFQQLRNSPHLSQLQGIMRESPHMLSSLLQVLANESPELRRAIQDNPQEFIRLLHGVDEEGGEMPRATITLSGADHEAVLELMSLGFSRELAVQAYLACDKNQELAANWLFDHADEMMDEGGEGDDGDQFM